jgi:hypothetical protein
MVAGIHLSDTTKYTIVDEVTWTFMGRESNTEWPAIENESKSCGQGLQALAN